MGRSSAVRRRHRWGRAELCQRRTSHFEKNCEEGHPGRAGHFPHLGHQVFANLRPLKLVVLTAACSRAGVHRSVTVVRVACPLSAAGGGCCVAPPPPAAAASAECEVECLLQSIPEGSDALSLVQVRSVARVHVPSLFIRHCFHCSGMPWMSVMQRAPAAPPWLLEALYNRRRQFTV